MIKLCGYFIHYGTTFKGKLWVLTHHGMDAGTADPLHYGNMFSKGTLCFCIPKLLVCWQALPSVLKGYS